MASFEVGKAICAKAYPVARQYLENPAAKAAVQGAKVWRQKIQNKQAV